MPKSIMIFTAGKGTRMAPLTDTIPKPMIEVSGRPLADYAYDLAREESLKPVMNLHHLPDQIRAYFTPKGVEFSDEGALLLETGGGLRKARATLGSNTVFTLNSDAIWEGPNPLSLLREAWDPAKMDALLMLLPLSHAHGRDTTSEGDFSCASSGQLRRGGSLLYSGAQIIKTNRLDEISEDVFSLNLYWDLLMESKKVFGISYPGQWCDVGRPSNIPTAESLISRHADV